MLWFRCMKAKRVPFQLESVWWWIQTSGENWRMILYSLRGSKWTIKIILEHFPCVYWLLGNNELKMQLIKQTKYIQKNILNPKNDVYQYCLNILQQWFDQGNILSTLMVKIRFSFMVAPLMVFTRGVFKGCFTICMLFVTETKEEEKKMIAKSEELLS